MELEVERKEQVRALTLALVLGVAYMGEHMGQALEVEEGHSMLEQGCIHKVRRISLHLEIISRCLVTSLFLRCKY